MTTIDTEDALGASRNLVVVSPHSDDAAFSVAGVLKHGCDYGKQITVITCFSRSRYAPRLYLRTTRRVTARRKKEDAAFMGLFAAADRMMWLDWDDAAL